MDIFCKIVNNELPSYTLYEDDIVKVLKEKLNYDWISLAENNGLGQEVKHFHLHLIPRYNNEKKIPVEEIYNILK